MTAVTSLLFLDFVEGFVDPGLHGPVSDQAVEEVVGKAQKAADLDVEVELQVDIPELAGEDAERLLRIVRQLAGIIDMGVLYHGA